MTNDELAYCLSRFVVEVRKTTGENYPSETIYELVICIQLYLSMHGREVRLLQEGVFSILKNTVDTRMKELAAAGHRAPRKQAAIITKEEEEAMWSNGVLGDDTPQKLVDTLLYLIGLHFALRAGEEHRNLRFENSQLSVHTDNSGEIFLKYTEDVSKSCQGGLKHRRVTPKSVVAYQNTTNSERCIVRLY